MFEFAGIRAKLRVLFKAFDTELQDVFKADGSLQVKSNGLLITETNAHVHIRGTLKSLRVNGKRIRFIKNE